MTKEKAKELLPIITAFAEGRSIQLKDAYGNWYNSINPDFSKNPEDYRIEPTLRYRPFENTKECWNEIGKHSHFGWIKFKDEEESYIHCEGIEDKGIFYNSISWTFENMLNDFTFVDGSPFGIKEE